MADDHRIDRSGDCHIWTGSRMSNHYGTFNQKLVHRLIWEEANGPIPPQHEICHRCDNPSCVRLDHLFLGSHHDNMLDAHAKGRINMSGLQRRGEWTHCKNGHEFTPENTYVTPKGSRECRICKKAKMDEWHRKHPNGKAS